MSYLEVAYQDVPGVFCFEDQDADPAASWNVDPAASWNANSTANQDAGFSCERMMARTAVRISGLILSNGIGSPSMTAL